MWVMLAFSNVDFLCPVFGMKKSGRLAGQDLLQGVGLEFPVQGTLDGRQLPVGDAVPLALPP